MGTRTTKKTVTNVTLEEAHEAANQYASASNNLSSIEAKMNAEIDKVKAKYQDDILENKQALEEPVEILEQFSKQDRENWKNKSVELLNVVIGFRTATPSVAKTKFTWDAILELVKKNKHLKQFVRTKDELDKKSILDCKDEKILSKLEDEAYIVIEQKETFFVEPIKQKVNS